MQRVISRIRRNCLFARGRKPTRVRRESSPVLPGVKRKESSECINIINVEFRDLLTCVYDRGLFYFHRSCPVGGLRAGNWNLNDTRNRQCQYDFNVCRDANERFQNSFISRRRPPVTQIVKLSALIIIVSLLMDFLGIDTETFKFNLQRFNTPILPGSTFNIFNFSDVFFRHFEFNRSS